MSKPKKFFVIGGAGFIGSHLVDQLLRLGEVTVYDNGSTGDLSRLPISVHAVKADARWPDVLIREMKGHDVVFHLSANPEARRGLEDTHLDLSEGTIATHNALEAARLVGVPQFFFASSGTVYGKTEWLCGEENLGLPISLYGASKLAGEALVCAYAECFGIRSTICRFGNVVGSRATHGVIFDFLKKLRATPDRLEVLGNGSQSKPYLHVSDCVKGILKAVTWNPPMRPLRVYNLAPADFTKVRYIAEACVRASPNPKAAIVYGESSQGWRGDVPTSWLDPSRARSELDFTVKYTSNEAVDVAIAEIAKEVFT